MSWVNQQATIWFLLAAYNTMEIMRGGKNLSNKRATTYYFEIYQSYQITNDARIKKWVPKDETQDSARKTWSKFEAPGVTSTFIRIISEDLREVYGGA